MYQIKIDLKSAAIYDYVEVYVNYYFGSSLYILSGSDIYTATNKTTPLFNTTYRFSTRVTSKLQ